MLNTFRKYIKKMLSLNSENRLSENPYKMLRSEKCTFFRKKVYEILENGHFKNVQNQIYREKII